MARRKGNGKQQRKKDWRRMLEADPLVQDLVKKFHQALERAKIIVLGKPKAGKKHGRLVYATAHRVSEAMAVLFKEVAGEDVHYYILVGLDAWEHLDTKHRRIVLDRALCHFAGQDGEKWIMRGPDVEEFTAILQRHGAWSPELVIFCKAAQQLDLNLTVVK